MSMRDPLGRPYRDDAPKDPPRERLLSDDAINQIAHEYRTKPTSDIGRHVMPLLTHVAELQDRTCDTCRFWVRWNSAHGARGECTRVAEKLSGVELTAVSQEGEKIDAVIAFCTAFDFGCRGWERQVAGTDEAQASL